MGPKGGSVAGGQASSKQQRKGAAAVASHGGQTLRKQQAQEPRRQVFKHVLDTPYVVRWCHLRAEGPFRRARARLFALKSHLAGPAVLVRRFRPGGVCAAPGSRPIPDSSPALLTRRLRRTLRPLAEYNRERRAYLKSKRALGRAAGAASKADEAPRPVGGQAESAPADARSPVREPERPSVLLRSVTLGLNSVTKALENAVPRPSPPPLSFGKRKRTAEEDERDSRRQSKEAPGLGGGASEPSAGGQTAEEPRRDDGQVSSETPRPADPAAGAPPVRAVFLCKGDIRPPHLYTHLPALSVQAGVRIVPLEKGSQARLAEVLGTKPIVVAVKPGTTELEYLCGVAEAKVPPFEMPWLVPAKKRAAYHETNPLQKILNNEFVSRLDESEESARVTLSDGYTYYSRKIPGQEYRIHCRMNQQGNNEVYLDENELARSETFANASFFRLGFVRHSPDCSVIAYGVDSSGNERYTAYFLNLATKQLLPDKICDVYEQFEFSNDGKYVFYLLVDEFERASSFWRHELTFGGDSGGAHAAGGNATNDEEDVLLYEEKDEMYCLTLTKTCNGRFLLLNSAAQITSETRLISADRPLDLPLVLFPRREKIQYTVESHRRFLYVLTNEESKNNWLFRVPFPQADDAEMYEMMLKAPHAGHLLGDNYRETVIPHRDFVLIEDFQVRARHLIVFERSNCLQNVRVVDLTNADSQSAPPSPLPPAYEDAAAAAPSHPARPAPSVQMGLFDSYHYVSFSEVVYSLWPVSTNEEVADLSKSVLFDTNLLRYTYTSFIQPKQVIDYNMDTRTSTVVHEE
ncbi:MAG: prolyl oligopeptidase, partial [Olpidium bornovanus]